MIRRFSGINIIFLFFVLQLDAQFVNVGQGSYTTVFPGVDAASRNSYPSGTPNLSGLAVGKPVPTNDWWSSLVKNDFSNNVFNYPLALRTYSGGLVVSYVVPASGPEGSTQPMSDVIPILVGVSGLSAARATVADYSDWTVTENWMSDTHEFSATICMGMPFLYFTKGDSDLASVNVTVGTVTIQDELLLITNGQAGSNYAVYAPKGSIWTKNGSVYTSGLNGKNYWSLCILPPATSDVTATANDFSKFAYVFPKNTEVTWQYDDSTSILRTRFKVSPEVMEGNDSLMLLGLLPHQWAHLAADSPLPGDYLYPTIRGEMKMLAGNAFYIENTFYGILPTLPYLAGYSKDFDPAELDKKVKQMENDALPLWTDSYNEGQLMNRLIQTARIADETGNVEAREKILTTIRERLENWLSAKSGEVAFLFYYNNTWSTLIGYPAGHGQDNNINDHHFHWGYFIHAAAFVEQFHPGWAAQWGDMVNLLVKDAANTDRNDSMFPFLRSFSPYDGHAWANGFATFPFGNDQESSSESMQFNSSLIHWGEITGNKAIRDLGIYLYTTEQTAIDEYWLDKKDRNLKPEYKYSLVSRIWGNGYDRQTFWTSDIAATYGIELYPIHGGSLYLGRDTLYAKKLWDEMAANTGILNNEANDNLWHDVYWEYLAFTNPSAAISLYNSFPGRSLKFGISDAQTYYWLHCMNALGRADGTVTADNPVAAVFVLDGKKTYVAQNYSTIDTIVHFSDGYNLVVPAGKLVTSRDISLSGKISSSYPEVFAEGQVTLTINVSGGDPDSIQIMDGNQWIGTLSQAPYTIKTNHLKAGVHTFYARLYSGSLFSFTNFVKVQSGRQIPYNGSAFNIPGTIEAGYYDAFEGGSGQGISYFDSSPENQAGDFRPGESVDAALDTKEGAVVGYITDGEWMEYTVDVQDAGKYSLTFRYACGNNQGGGPFHLELDGKDISGNISVAATSTTNQWDVWVNKTIPGLGLTQGKHVLRLAFDHGELNLGKITFSRTGDLDYIPPVADAGKNQVVVLPENTCTLDGSMSTGAASFLWKEIYGPSVATVSDSVSITTTISGLEEGVYLFRLTVQDSIYTDASEVLVIVSPTATLPPTVSLNAPADQTIIPEGTELTLQASADDLDGTISQLEFFANDTSIGVITSAPYKLGWAPLSGNYLLKVVATDNDGLTDTSGLVHVHVTEPPPCYGVPKNGDFTWVFSPDNSNPTITFVPTVTGTGNSVCIFYYSRSSGGPWPGANVKPNIPYRITASKGETIYFYYTYSTSSGEKNTLNDLQHFVIGNCEALPSEVVQDKKQSLQLFPNPVHNQLNIAGIEAGSQVQLVDLCGRVLLSKEFTSGQFTLDLQHFRAGIFLVRIYYKGQVSSYKIVKVE